MHNQRKKSKNLFYIITLIVVITYIVQINNIIHFPSQIDIFKGETKNIDIVFPFTIEISEDNNSILKITDDDNQRIGLKTKNSFDFETIENGNAKLEFRFLGILPVKNVEVNVVDKICLIPGGHSIGVKLNTKGVLIVGLSEITGTDGESYNPAKEAGLKVGDIILEINSVKIKDSDHVIKLLNEIKREKVTIKIQRKNNIFTTSVKPIKCEQDNSYRIGLWVRDKTAGIGTMTFYEQNTKKFGALGHGITDIDTGQLMPVEKGEIMKARVSGIAQGKKGEPGEIRGIFFESENLIGKIEKNTSFGIYGTALLDIENEIVPETLPIALQHEVKVGKAHILTTTENNKIEKYDISIIKKQIQTKPNQKSMVIKIVDKKLLEKTGGIVQGMSGSPIIQDGKIVGAVTHVFVNDPTKGYGLYIEWMLKEAGLSVNDNSEYAKGK